MKNKILKNYSKINLKSKNKITFPRPLNSKCGFVKCNSVVPRSQSFYEEQRDSGIVVSQSSDTFLNKTKRFSSQESMIQEEVTPIFFLNKSFFSFKIFLQN